MKYKQNDRLHGFKVELITPLPKLKNIMYQLVHEKTGARMIHLENDDDNNCFSVGFRTTPQDSTGVAHILEHLALCGSAKFPVRDPFFSMIRRSMKTFMNAMTASDWTMYPFASQNRTDFYNLMQVYLDAAFFPNLSELNFKQEGHRVEFTDPDNSTTPLIIKGIVYNEMKGAMSSASSVMIERLNASLYPTITYKYNSGGEPTEIPNLTWAHLKAFHQRYYHPSNAFFYTYGTFDLEEHLRVLDQTILQKFQRINPQTSIPDEQRYTAPQQYRYYYPLTAEEDDGAKNQIALSWLTCKIHEPLEVLTLDLINDILLGNPAAPLRKVLMDSNLGKALADTTGYENDLRETYFSVGLQGVKEKDLSTVADLILTTLEKIVAQGIDQEKITAAIHQLEIATREISGGSYPYGLNLLFRFFGTWIHEGDPVSAIDFDSNLIEIKRLINQGSYLEQKIQQYFLDNQHRVYLELLPDHHLEQKQEKELEQSLAKIQENLSPTDQHKIIQDAEQLKIHQEQQEDLSCLPRLEIKDIPREILRVDPFKINQQEPNITFYDQPTNGLIYINWDFNQYHFQKEDRLWLPLLGYLLPKCGTQNQSYDQTAILIDRYTGGISASPALQMDIFNPQQWQDFFDIGGKALAENYEQLINLVYQFLTAWNFNEDDWIKTLIKQRANALENSIIQVGHSYAASLAQRNFNPCAYLHEIYDGIAQVQFMKQLAKNCDQDFDKIKQKLTTLIKNLFDPQNLSILVIGEQESFAKIENQLVSLNQTLLNHQKPQSISSLVDDLENPFLQEVWTTTTPVSYVAQCLPTTIYTDDDSPKLQVLSNLIQSCYLHGEIREKGGAYGGQASFNPESGVFSMLSYRDPHLSRTVNVFQKTMEWLSSNQVTDQNVEEAILQTCSKIDIPLSPAGKALLSYHQLQKGKTYEMRTKFRTSILNSTKKDLLNVAEKWLVNPSSIVAITSQEIATKEQKKLDEMQFKIKNI